MRKIFSFIFLLFSAFCFAQSPIKVACIGNSVTYGYGHANPNETSYPQQLSKLLGDGYKVGNFGKSGATLLNKGHRPYTQQPECKAALEFAPDIAVIHLGLNDTDPRNWPNYKDEFIPDYMALIDTLRDINPAVKVYVCRMTPIFHWHRRFKSGTRDWYWQIQSTIENIANVVKIQELIDLLKERKQEENMSADKHPEHHKRDLLLSDRISQSTVKDIIKDIFEIDSFENTRNVYTLRAVFCTVRTASTRNRRFCIQFFYYLINNLEFFFAARFEIFHKGKVIFHLQCLNCCNKLIGTGNAFAQFPFVDRGSANSNSVFFKQAAELR